MMITAMKNLLILVAMLFAATTVYASGTVRYYSLTSPNTPHLPLMQQWTNSMKNHMDVDFRPGLGCAGISSYARDQNTKIVEFSTGPAWQSLQTGRGECVVDTENLHFISVLVYAYDICVPVNSNINSINDVLKGKNFTMAHSDRTAMPYWARDFSKKYNVNVKPIVYQNSGAAMAGMLAGDTDMSFVASLVAHRAVVNNQAKCFATTDTSAPNSLSKLTPLVAPELNEHSNLIALAAAGASSAQLAIISDAVNANTKELPAGVTIIVANTPGDQKKIADFMKQQIFGLLEFTKDSN
jgi:hypothetical protein